ncbi:hypothetical protein Tco_0397071 [Tanacetum coccineum]
MSISLGSWQILTDFELHSLCGGMILILLSVNSVTLTSRFFKSFPTRRMPALRDIYGFFFRLDEDPVAETLGMTDLQQPDRFPATTNVLSTVYIVPPLLLTFPFLSVKITIIPESSIWFRNASNLSSESEGWLDAVS